MQHSDSGKPALLVGFFRGYSKKMIIIYKSYIVYSTFSIHQCPLLDRAVDQMDFGFDAAKLFLQSNCQGGVLSGQCREECNVTDMTSRFLRE